MQFVKEFDDLDTTSLVSYLSHCKQEFLTSQLYNSVRDEKFVDVALRHSQYRAIVDPELFDIAAAFVADVSKKDKINNYSLVRNDVTQIVYKPGGFFKAHEDYLSVTSNVVEEYTMLICITDPGKSLLCVGGQTRINVNPYFTHTSSATTTPGHALLFRKDLQHEGLLLETGEKQIVSLNVWATRKTCSQILLVSFPRMMTVDTDVDTTNGHEDTLQAVSSGKSYAIATSLLQSFPDSFLTGLCHFKTASASASAVSLTILYECTQATYEQFRIIFRVVCGMYVSVDDVTEHKDTLDFFGIPTNMILIDITSMAANPVEIPMLLNVDGTVIDDGVDGVDGVDDGTAKSPRMGLGEMCCANCGRTEAFLATGRHFGSCSKCKATTYCSRVCQLTHWHNSHSKTCGKPGVSDAPVNKNLIVCESSERTDIVAGVANTMGLPFIRFRIIFAEGELVPGGGATGDPHSVFAMDPVWISLGDYDNILAFCALGSSTYASHICLSNDTIFDSIDAPSCRLKRLETSGSLVLFQKYEFDKDDVGSVMMPDSCDDNVFNIGLRLAYCKNSKKDAHITMMSSITDRGYTLSGVVLPENNKEKNTPMCTDRTCADCKSCYDSEDVVDDESSDDSGDSGDSGNESGAGGNGGNGGNEKMPIKVTQDTKPVPNGGADTDVDDNSHALSTTISKYFHIDKLGKSCFTREEADLTTSRVAKLDLVGQVKKYIKTLQFELPQQKKTVDEHFCNESVYGNLNLLMVTGVVNLNDLSIE